MRKIIVLILITLTIISCTQVKEKTSFRITGTIDQNYTKTNEIILVTQTKEVQDTVVTTSGNFEFNGKVSEPTNAAIIIGKKMIKFPLVNDEIGLRIINVENNEFEIKYQNSKVNKNLQSYYNKDSKEYIEKYKLFEEQEVKSKNDSIKHKIMISKDSLAIDFLRQLIHKYKDSPDKSGFSIIVYDLKGLIGTKNNPTEIGNFFKLLPVNEKNGFYGSKIKTYLEQSSNIALGQKINFDFIDINGKPYSLNEFRGKLILLEFWATWCGPCISQIPFLKQVSAKSDRIQVISISIDKDLDKWKTKVNDLNMNWINIHFNQENINLKKYFFISSVPYNILVSTNGEILRKNITMNELLKLLN